MVAQVRVVNTSRRSLVSSLSTIPEIINVLLMLRILLKIERKRGGVWKGMIRVIRWNICVYTEENFRNVN